MGLSKIHTSWQIKKYFRKAAKTRWRSQYLKKALRPGRAAILVRLILTVMLTAELIYGAGIIARYPRLVFETVGIQVISETGESGKWTVKGPETNWGIRVGPDGIELYREEIGLNPISSSSW